MFLWDPAVIFSAVSPMILIPLNVNERVAKMVVVTMPDPTFIVNSGVLIHVSNRTLDPHLVFDVSLMFLLLGHLPIKTLGWRENQEQPAAPLETKRPQSQAQTACHGSWHCRPDSESNVPF
jgi:hypothetical protein